MSLFSKKISTDKIANALTGFFDNSYGLLVMAFKTQFKEQQPTISEEQDKELIVVSLLEIVRAVLATFGDTPITKNIIGKFQHDIFNKYFKETEERNKFGELFWKRCNEYSEVLNPENKDVAIQFGQIFCNHFFGKEEDGSHLTIMMFVGGTFLAGETETKKVLDELASKFTIY